VLGNSRARSASERVSTLRFTLDERVSCHGFIGASSYATSSARILLVERERERERERGGGRERETRDNDSSRVSVAISDWTSVPSVFHQSGILEFDRTGISANIQPCKQSECLLSFFCRYRVTRVTLLTSDTFEPSFSSLSLFAAHRSIFYDNSVSRNSILAFKYFYAFENLINRNPTPAVT